MTEPTRQAIRAALIASPALFPLHYDHREETVQFLRLSQADYQSASFLDNRVVLPCHHIGLLAFDDMQNFADTLPRNCDFIFHVSHTGSTLVSRLLAEHPLLFCLREPAILRELDRSLRMDRMDPFLGLWSRVFDPEQRSIIKATSFVSESSAKLMQHVRGSRALLMYIPIETFLPALLDGAMVDIHAHAQERLARLQRRQLLLDSCLQELCLGERVAMSWLSEMTSLRETAACFPDRVLWINFDEFLLRPETMLVDMLNHFHVDPNLVSIRHSSVINRYAKNPNVHYSPSFRSQQLLQSSEKHADEIERGMDWIKRHDPNFVPP